MHPALFFTPLIPAIICWLLIKFSIKYFFKPLHPVKILGNSFRGILPHKKEFIVKSLSQIISDELLNADMLKEKLTDPEILQKAMPVIETHIDNFLNVKLKESIPVIGMFIGDRITKQLKDLFMKELEELFPSVMSQFMSDLSQSKNLEHEIVVKLDSIQIETVENRFYQTFKKELKRIEFTFAFIGLAAGIFQLIIILIVLK
ncbi:MAG TPA: hypothetical protein VN958_21130 [Chitinophagaceae bacterium]|nr:hypothetical protein [Chitinophagaceae bacterium]